MSFLNSIKNNSSKHVAPFDHWEYSDALSEGSIEEIIKADIPDLSKLNLSYDGTRAIDGGEGDDYLAYAGSTLNLSDFTDTQITGIENIDIQFNSPTLLTITKQSILDLDGEIFYDLDGDGDDDEPGPPGRSLMMMMIMMMMTMMMMN